MKRTSLANDWLHTKAVTNNTASINELLTTAAVINDSGLMIVAVIKINVLSADLLGLTPYS